MGRLALETRAASLADALPGNAMLWRPSVYESSRVELWRLYRARGYENMARKLRYYPSALRATACGLKAKAKSLVKALVFALAGQEGVETVKHMLRR